MGQTTPLVIRIGDLFMVFGGGATMETAVSLDIGKHRLAKLSTTILILVDLKQVSFVSP